jgi:hypothetical protein
MGQLIQFSDYQNTDIAASVRAMDSLIPIEFGIGESDRQKCISRMASYGSFAIQIRMINDRPEALLYLMRVSDAIWFNKQVLEKEELSERELVKRIDLIQMLENSNSSLMNCIWESFTRQNIQQG